MLSHLLNRKETHFVLWRPGKVEPTPTLYIGKIESHNNPYDNFREITLQQSIDFPELWEISAKDCNLTESEVYFYWFKVRDANVYNETHPILYCTDPTAWTVDRRFLAPVPSESEGAASHHPASVILYQNGKLIPCDPNGQTVEWEGDAALETLPTNNRLIIYQLPTRWTRIDTSGKITISDGTFQDVVALFVQEKGAPNFPGVDELENQAHLIELGINALELLPPADSQDKLEWGYGTANYFAADFQLGFPDSQSVSTPSTDLVHLIKTCHQKGVRFLLDVAMAFARNNPYRAINYLDFYVEWNSGDPEQYERNAFGGDLFKYNYWVEDYHPISGDKSSFVPAREYMKTHIDHWINYYRVDGLRLDSINTIHNYNFVEEFKEFSRTLWQKRGGSSDNFLVAGEESSVPLTLIHQNRLDTLWNKHFKRILRQVILGQNADSDSSFEWSVRKMIDCRFLGFTDSSQVINYVTSHDVGGMGNERLYNYLINNGINDTEPRIKLAFVCLLTAIGIPMILAGEEFGDRHDLDIFNVEPEKRVQHKQVDPVNYSRIEQDGRRQIFSYVARLVHLRKSSDALAVNDTNFIHADFHDGKRVVVWQRGSGENLVIVVANFSEYGTPNSMSSASSAGEYVVPNWPPTPEGKYWHEITQDRRVPPEWVGREAIFPWEAKVYALV
ncbi:MULTISPECIES: alpha-amylase family glycosyl hydrolase [unclassified Coleofasciculus]|uniref:alpha-amylase family glycosyl hydrolase n=1 Tax=unclassified Coleofasciculus TaxID=2692782 RepID=UPI00188107E0|nr:MULTISPECIES: alpha-amylase family glycosyl hydrolase [unclassified Coleofasciculus]MBE9128164.1 alpha amylase [Coleofasciculus sp. LEGE 07081]MBE9149735.1 alpha amylase [Coleofasciculus sp. LEGE 07092]